MSEIVFTIVIFVFFILAMSIVYNNLIVVRKYRVKTGRQLPKKRIVYLADIFSNNHSLRINAIIEKVKKCNPDIIILSGKVPDGFKDKAPYVLSQLSGIACVYAAFSNITDNQNCTLISNDNIKIFNEYSILSLSPCENKEDILTSFSKLENIKILICQKPSDFNYSVYNKQIDLTFSYQGGGIMLRLPFYGLIYSSAEGFLPGHPGRFYNINGCPLVVTTGVGKAFLPVRISNFREIPCVDIE